MTDEDVRRGVEEERERFRREVEGKERRWRRARETGDRSLRYGLRAFGAIGWSIVVPTLLGVALGAWLDGRAGGGLRYTLSLMVAGLLVGFVNAWKWLQSGE